MTKNSPATWSPNSTSVLDRIYAAYLSEEGGVEALAEADRKVMQQIEAAYGLLLNYHSMEQAVPLLVAKFDISRATAYRRCTASMKLFGDVKKVPKEARRAILQEYTMKVLQLALSASPPNLTDALNAIRTMATLAQLQRPDEQENPANTAPTAYILNLTVEGRKPRQVDLSKLGELTEAEYADVVEAVEQAAPSADDIRRLLAGGDRKPQEADQ